MIPLLWVQGYLQLSLLSIAPAMISRIPFASSSCMCAYTACICMSSFSVTMSTLSSSAVMLLYCANFLTTASRLLFSYPSYPSCDTRESLCSRAMLSCHAATFCCASRSSFQRSTCWTIFAYSFLVRRTSRVWYTHGSRPLRMR